MKKINESYKLIVFAALALALVWPAESDFGFFAYYTGWSPSLYL